MKLQLQGILLHHFMLSDSISDVLNSTLFTQHLQYTASVMILFDGLKKK